MKKLITFFSFAVLMTAMCVMSGCKDDDKDDDKGGSSNAKALVGRWMLFQWRNASTTEWTDFYSIAVVGSIQFSADGKYSTALGDFKQTGKYEVNGKKIVVSLDNNVTQTYGIEQMSKDNADMVIVLYKSDGKTPDVYYRYVRYAATADEAKQMIVGQWKWVNMYEGYSDYIEEYYIEYTADGKKYTFSKIKADAKGGEWYSPFRGKYVGWLNEEHITYLPDEQDPSYGEIKYYNTEYWPYYVNLTKQSVGIGINNSPWQFIRQEKRIDYTLIEYPY